jgi:hypothetical protein
VPKPITGSVLTRRLADDTLVVDVKIRTERQMLGPAAKWSEARARKLLESRLLSAAQLRQDWTALIPGAGNRGPDGESAGPLTVREARPTTSRRSADTRIRCGPLGDPEYEPRVAQRAHPSKPLRSGSHNAPR